MLKVYTPADEAFETIFHGVTMASLHKEWKIPPIGEDTEGDEVVEDNAENVALADDELVQKVLRTLQSEDEMEEIAVETHSRRSRVPQRWGHTSQAAQDLTSRPDAVSLRQRVPHTRRGHRHQKKR